MKNLSYNLIKASRLFKYALDQELSTYDITSAQFAVLNQIHLAKIEMTAARIADNLSSDRPTISAVINRLVKKGVIYKVENPKDKRSSFINLTPEGQDLIHRLVKKSDELSGELLSVLEEDELEKLNGYLSRIIQRIEVES